LISIQEVFAPQALLHRLQQGFFLGLTLPDVKTGCRKKFNRIGLATFKLIPENIYFNIPQYTGYSITLFTIFLQSLV
jgi:hypothetical protein